jgi:hypothetical protein
LKLSHLAEHVGGMLVAGRFAGAEHDFIRFRI